MPRTSGLLAIAMGVAAAGGAAHAAPVAQTLTFKGAELGMSLQAWKALPFPGGLPAIANAAGASPICTDDPASARLGMAVSTTERQAGVIGCTYVYGPADGAGPRRQVPLTAQTLADHVLYKFRGDRLVSISYRTTVDAFDDIVARLRAEAGAPIAVQRDAVPAPFGQRTPRVRMTWRTASGSVLLTDPCGPLNRLSVTLTTAPASAPAPSGGGKA